MPFLPGAMLYFIVPFVCLCAVMLLGALMYEKWPSRRKAKR